MKIKKLVNFKDILKGVKRQATEWKIFPTPTPVDNTGPPPQCVDNKIKKSYKRKRQPVN